MMRSAHVFTDDDGDRLDHNAVKDLVPRICRRAGLPKRPIGCGLKVQTPKELVTSMLEPLS
jgi:hypothetical protein